MYHIGGVVSPTGGSDAYDSSVARPDRVLDDLASMITPAAGPFDLSTTYLL